MTRFTLCTVFICLALFCPVVLQAQGGGDPKITNIPGGFFVEWESPVKISMVQLSKKLSGAFEMMFDVPSVDILVDILDRKTSSGIDPDMVTVLADYWIVRGKPERAIPLYEGSLKQGTLDDEKAVIFQNNLAMLYSQVLKQHGKALDVVDKALETRKDNFILLDTKGLILLNSGNPTAAVPVLQRAVELSCQLPIYCMHLAYALHQIERSGPARRWFDQARAQLTEKVPSMGKDNVKMFDTLQSLYPPVDE